MSVRPGPALPRASTQRRIASSIEFPAPFVLSCGPSGTDSALVACSFPIVPEPWKKVDGNTVTIALADKARKPMVVFFDEWFRRYGATHVAHCPDYVMHGGITVSVDEVGAVNEEMFGTFFRDELAALSGHFAGLGIHCCADARHPWGNFRALPGLKVMNHNVPPVRTAREYILDSLRFYGPEVVQVPIGWTPVGPPESWPAQFAEGTRIVFEVAARNADEAAAIADRLQAARRAEQGRRS